MRQEVEPIILPIINDPNLPTLDKLHRFFDTAGRWKTARKEYFALAAARLVRRRECHRAPKIREPM